MVCALCKKELTGTDYKTKNRKRYHNECYEQLINKAEQSTQTKAKSLKQGDKEALVQYICKLYGLQELPYAIDKQIEDYIAQRKYTYLGIQEALYYFYEIGRNGVGKYNNTIGIVPYCYDDAQAFIRTTREANETNKNFVSDEQTITVKVKPQSRAIPYTIRIEDL